MGASRDYRLWMNEALEAASDNGWVYTGDGTLRRSSSHATPDQMVKAGWWPEPVYETHEFVTLVMRGVGRVPLAVYGVTKSPWTSRTDRKISLRKALELLAQPQADSEVHAD